MIFFTPTKIFQRWHFSLNIKKTQKGRGGLTMEIINTSLYTDTIDAWWGQLTPLVFVVYTLSVPVAVVTRASNKR